jgi:hypothetical protein
MTDNEDYNRGVETRMNARRAAMTGIDVETDDESQECPVAGKKRLRSYAKLDGNDEIDIEKEDEGEGDSGSGSGGSSSRSRKRVRVV